jgi:putative transposase
MSYTRVYIHYVWATKYREPMLIMPYRQQLFTHIRQNALLKGVHLDKINGHIDHVHCLVKLQPGQSIGRVAQLLKGESTYWFNRQPGTGRPKLEWQENYFAVSVSLSQLHTVRNYIDKQEEHHARKDFATEYQALLKQFLFVKTLENDGEHFRVNTGRYKRPDE